MTEPNVLPFLQTLYEWLNSDLNASAETLKGKINQLFQHHLFGLFSLEQFTDLHSSCKNEHFLRWLAQNGKSDEAMKILLKMARINGRSLNNNEELEMKKIINDIGKNCLPSKSWFNT